MDGPVRMAIGTGRQFGRICNYAANWTDISGNFANFWMKIFDTKLKVVKKLQKIWKIWSETPFFLIKIAIEAKNVENLVVT